MSQQLTNALEDVGKAMSTLRLAIKGIPVRREGFKGLHDQFARSVATLTTHMSHARVLLGERCRHECYSAQRREVSGYSFHILCSLCRNEWVRSTPYPPRF